MRISWLAAFAILTFSSVSFAQEDPLAGDPAVEGGVDAGDVAAGGGLPVAYVQRPLTLPEMTLAPEGSFVGTHVDFGAGSLNAFFITAGASFGITDDIMVEAIPLSVVFGDPEFDYAYFMGGATARFLEGDFEMGGRFRFIITNAADLGFNLGVPMRLHADIVRLDTGVHTFISVPTGGGDPAVGLTDFNKNFFVPDPGIPAKLSVQIIEQFWAGLGTGFGILDFGEAGDTIFVPLQINAGGTIPTDEGRPLVDIEGGFSFPTFVNSGAPDTIVTEIWQFGVIGTGYLDL
jgi:hypothetical protein